MNAPIRPPAGFGFAVRRPVAVLMIFAALIVFGVFSVRLLPLNLMPNIAYPKLTVRTAYPGAAPGEVELNVSRPLEEVLGVVSGVTRVESLSRAGYSDVVLEFGWDTDMDEANQDVLEVLDTIAPNLPDDVEDPLILRYDPSLDPVLTLSVTGEGPRFEGDVGRKVLRRLADRELRRGLEPLVGVAALQVKGGLEEEIEVELDEAALRRLGLGIEVVVERLDAENVNLAGGTLQDGRSRYLVRTVNEFEDLSELGDVVLRREGPRQVRLRDVARIHYGTADREIITRVDGVEAVEIEIYKEADANIVEMAQRVRDHLEEVAGPELERRHGAKVRVSSDRSRFIESSLAEVQRTAVLGGVLAVLVLFVFLRDLRSTVIVAVSIPVSIAMTFAPLHLAGVSLNIMSLGGLALGIGMLVDNSIVVLESIYRCREEGDDLVGATLRGTQEVGTAVIAATLTSVAVFFPMVFVEGVAGQMFGDLGLAVVFSLLASLLVALFLVPMLASRGAESEAATDGPTRSRLAELWTRFAAWDDLRAAWGWMCRRPWAFIGFPYVVVRFVVHLSFSVLGKLLWTIALVVIVVVGGLVVVLRGAMRWVLTPLLVGLGAVGRGGAHLYGPLLRGCLRRPGLVAMLSLLGIVGVAYTASRIDTELIPTLHQGEFTADLSYAVGTPLEVVDAELGPLEREVLDEVPHRSTLTTIVGTAADATEGVEQGQHTARFRVTLEPPEGASRPARVYEEEALAVLRGIVADEPDLHMDIRRPVLFSFKPPIEVEVRGHDLEALAEATAKVEAVLSGLPGLRDVRGSIRPGSPEVHLLYDRDALARYGLDIRAVAERVRDEVQGKEATQFTRSDRKIPVRVRLAGIESASKAELSRLVVNPGSEHPIPLGAVATIEVGRGPNEIRRIGQQRVGVVTANVEDTSLGAAVESIEAALRDTELGPGIRTATTGQSAEWERSSRSLALALGLSVFLVYVLMAAQFESLVYPLVILFSIPLAFVGVVLVLVLGEIPLSVVVLLGAIMLTGIVVNNAIVLVDYVGKLKARGLDTFAALEEAGRVRLRPILMTTATTVLGLLPMAWGWGDGAEIRRPMALTVIAGLSLSTVLTLVVIPVLYSTVDRWFGGRGGRGASQRLDEDLARVRPPQLRPEADSPEEW